MSAFVLLGDCITGRRVWDVPAVCAELAGVLLGTDHAESAAMLEIADSWTAASDSHQLINDLFASGRLTGDRDSYDNHLNSFIHSSIQRGKGIPLTLGWIAVELGRRRGINLEIAGMPGHVLVVDREAGETFFDPFHGGKRLDSVGCRVLYERLTGLDNWREEFLVSIDESQQVFRMLNNLKSIYRRAGDLPRLRQVMMARSLYPVVGAAERDEFARFMRETN